MVVQLYGHSLAWQPRLLSQARVPGNQTALHRLSENCLLITQTQTELLQYTVLLDLLQYTVLLDLLQYTVFLYLLQYTVLLDLLQYCIN